METRSIIILVIVLCGAGAALYYIAAWSFFDSDVEQQQAYTTDGCTFVAEKFKSESVIACCDVHDRAYWQGGSHEDRARVDQEFKICVAEDVDSKHAQKIAFAAYGAVRVLGTAYINVPWRWGYGWKFGRGYRE